MRNRLMMLSMACAAVGILLSGCGDHVKTYSYKTTDVSEMTAEAQKLYEEEQYDDSLSMYLDAMEADPKDEEARLGVIRNQIALENYDIAVTDIQMLFQVNPYNEEAYELYMEIGQLTDNMNMKRNVVSLAKKYDIRTILDTVPAAPAVSVESGLYQEPILVSLVSEDPSAEIYYTFTSNLINGVSNTPYANEISIVSGESTITAYTVLDGIPSEDVSENYKIDYDGSRQDFTDPLMGQLVANRLKKEVGMVTDLDCWRLTDLNMNDLWTNNMSYDEYQKLQLQSLEDLKHMPNLNYIYLSNQKEIDSYDPLKYCNNIDNLNIRSNDIDSIDFVRNLKNLRYLYFDKNNVTDISPLYDCKQLKGISVDGNPISNVDQLFEHLKLSSVSIDAKMLSDYSLLAYDELTSLTIYGLNEIDYEALGKMTQLKSLSVQIDYNSDYNDLNRTLQSTDFLKNLTNLTYLSLQGIQDSKMLENIYGLKNLETLYLYGSDIGDDEQALEALRNALPNCDIWY